MQFQDSFLLRMWLVLASLISFLVSVLYLFLFTLPHAYWMPAVPNWQELSSKFLSQLHKDTDWKPDDENLLLLVSVTNLVGSIGYDKFTFYTKMSPYWSTVLTTTSIFSMVMVLASCLMLWYLICNYKLSLRFIPIPWFILQAMLLIVVAVGLILLLVDMDSPSRLEMEHMMGKGNYARVLTVMMVTLLYLHCNIMAVFFHMDEKMVEKERLVRLAKFFSLVDISFSSTQPGAPRQEQHPSGNSLSCLLSTTCILILAERWGGAGGGGLWVVLGRG